tara:strand:+ start:20 stop:202 length:183 start_codon:yes stop_codon:yes gene_type:complete
MIGPIVHSFAHGVAKAADPARARRDPIIKVLVFFISPPYPAYPLHLLNKHVMRPKDAMIE